MANSKISDKAAEDPLRQPAADSSHQRGRQRGESRDGEGLLPAILQLAIETEVPTMCRNLTSYPPMVTGMENRILTGAHIENYAALLQQEERAPATVEKYRHAARAFLTWLDSRTVSRETDAQWKAHLLDQRLTPATVNARLSAVNGLFHFLGWDGCRVRLLKLQRRTFRDASRDLTRSDYACLVAAASGQVKLLLQTICATGIRVSEVRYITVEAARAGRANIALKGKIRTILLPGKLCRKLLQFAKKHKIASGEIFLTKGGKTLSRQRIWQHMKTLCEKAGVPPTKVLPHNLRHLFAAAFYQATRDIVKLADVLGHSSINTTRIYLLTTGAEHGSAV